MNTVNRIKQINTFGQSVWLDYLSRSLIESGMLRQLIEEDGISGVTTNPAIFEKAVTAGTVYDNAIRAMARQGKPAEAIYRTLAVQDVTAAADILYSVYESTDHRDGYVSIEVSPHLAYDTAGTVREARALWKELDRPNVLIKVPGTEAGLPAIRQLIRDGINVNVTLLFGLDRYRQVTGAWLTGLEERLAAGDTLRQLPVSVASLFLSRIDTLVDSLLESRQANVPMDEGEVQQLSGKAAVATARLAYHEYQTMVSSDRFRSLAKQGGRPQHLLWASTGTKNPAYEDTCYVDPLIGPETITTLPMETIDAYRDHGRPEVRLTVDGKEAEAVITGIRLLTIDLQNVAKQLEDEGVRKFITAHDQLVNSIETICSEVSRQ
ncbi:MAG: transaldolase [Gammaproteobacteria bacterium]